MGTFLHLGVIPALRLGGTFCACVRALACALMRMEVERELVQFVHRLVLKMLVYCSIVQKSRIYSAFSTVLLRFQATCDRSLKTAFKEVRGIEIRAR